MKPKSVNPAWCIFAIFVLWIIMVIFVILPFEYNECRKVGHGKIYCIWTLGR
jgi:hypothetical protein